MAAAGDLPAELDFFKYAQNITGKRKRTVQAEVNQARPRRRKEGPEGDSQNETESNLIPTANRVKTKGSNIPTNITTFEELRKYSIPAHLYPNLAAGRYRLPTGVQSHCIPILLEVSTCSNAVARIMIILGSRPCCNFPDRYWENVSVPSPNFCTACCTCGKHKR